MTVVVNIIITYVNIFFVHVFYCYILWTSLQQNYNGYLNLVKDKDSTCHFNLVAYIIIAHRHHENHRSKPHLYGIVDYNMVNTNQR